VVQRIRSVRGRQFCRGRAYQGIRQAGLEAGVGIGTGQATDTERDAGPQSGATEPGSWIDKMAKVITPATEVTNVDARAAGATCDGRRPVPIRIEARIEPPPVCPCRQYRYSAPGVATTLYSRLVGVTDGLGVPST
jgi:hypothetical protein